MAYQIPSTITLTVGDNFIAGDQTSTFTMPGDPLRKRMTEFAAQRDAELRSADTDLEPLVFAALTRMYDGDDDWYLDLVEGAETLWLETYGQVDGAPEPSASAMNTFGSELGAHLLETSTRYGTTTESQTGAVTRWVSTFTVNNATELAAGATGADLAWVTMDDEDVRASHAALDGTIRPPGGTFDVDGVPLHYPGEPVGPPDAWINCVPASTQVAWGGQDVLAATRRQHMGPLMELRTRDGHDLTITPNHPVLTTTGYIPAGDLRPGDQVLASPQPVSPEVADAPPSIEQVYRTAGQLGETSRVRGSGVDFHGDGADAEVEVVRAHSDLPLEVGGQAREPVLVGTHDSEPVLEGGRLHAGIVGGGQLPGGPVSERILDAPGLVRGEGVDPAFGGAHPGHADAVRLGGAAAGQAEQVELSRDNVPTDAEFRSHLQDALALGMAPTEIISVERSTGSAHVFNLETSDHWYSANGIAIHNCRCVLLPLEAQMTAAAVAPEALTEPAVEPAVDAGDPTEGYDALEHDVPWYGVLAPVGVRSGDRREIAPGSLRFRNLPLPLTWQKITADRHNGSVVVGNITEAWEQDGLIHARGMFASTAEAAEVVTLIAEGMLRGVSVDLDGDTTFELVGDDGAPFDLESYSPGDPEPIARVVDGRVTSASIVSIPAFQEAFVRLGTPQEAQAAEPVLTAAGGCIPCAASEMDGYYEVLQSYAISEASWDGSASRFDDDQWKKSTIVDRGESYATAKERYAVPIKEPGGDLSRAAVHNAAARIDQVDAPATAISAGKRKLVAAYRQLDETPPDGLQAAAVAWTGVYQVGDTGDDGDASQVAAVEEQIADALRVPLGALSTEARDALRRVVNEGLERRDDGEDTAPPAGDGQMAADDASQRSAIENAVADALRVPLTALSDQARADLTLVIDEALERRTDDDANGAPGDDAGQGRPFAVTSNPGTHDGPGWITNPDDTQRLRTYWTRGEGAAKIRWGEPGDFNRCRTQLAKYIPNPHYLAGTCANLHKVAIGVWPGQEAAAEVLTADAAPAFTLTAAAPGARAPGAWFEDPQLAGPTPLTVEYDEAAGMHRVFGHLAAWGTCHIGLGLSVGDGNECITPPESASNYAYFRTDAVRTAEDGVVPVGHITLGTGHAPASMASRPAAAHYDNTGSVVADVAAGEDAHGIWVAGALRAGADPDALQAASLSGDWRTIGGAYELVAALGVNVPGFPIPRMQIAASASGTSSLVAAGVVLPWDRSQFDATTMAKDVYNETMAIGRRAARRRQLTTDFRVQRRAELTARLVSS